MPDPSTVPENTEQATVDLRKSAASAKENENERLNICVRVHDPWLSLATTSLLEESGYRAVTVDNGSDFVVTDNEKIHGDRVVLFIDDQAATAQSGLNALLKCEVGALVSKNNPGHLPIALNALACGMFAAPHEILEGAIAAPVLDRRQQQIIRLIGSGLSNPQIATRLSISEATVKREVTQLRRLFTASTRVELALRANKLGYKPTK